MPTPPPVQFGKERKPHRLRSMGVLQVPLPRLLRVLRSRQRRLLLAISPKSNHPLLQKNPTGQNEMLLRQTGLHEHV